LSKRIPAVRLSSGRADAPRRPPRAIREEEMRFMVVVIDEERRLDARLPELLEQLVEALPDVAEQLASCGASVDAAADRGE